MEAGRLELARAPITVDFLRDEVERLRADGEKSMENLMVWVERASKAELRLEEAAKANIQDDTGKRSP